MNHPYVMVVDDDEALRESVCELLEEDGTRTLAADSGATALTRLRESTVKPDLILLDLMMPVVNGWQFREAQLNDPELSKIPVVVMSASRDLKGITADEIVHKPLTLRKLQEVVRRHARSEPPHVSNGEGTNGGSAAPDSSTTPKEYVPKTSGHGALFAGGGELGTLMAAMDWSTNPLGPVETWSQSLRTCVRILLTSRQPMLIWWGEELINLYNDAYLSIIGGKHPQALGQPASVVWHEIWDQVRSRVETAMRANEGTYDEAFLLIMERHGYEEETYYTFSYSPVPNDSGGTGGIICANTDDTERIIGGRRLALLRELAGRTAEGRTAQGVCQRSAAALSINPRDIPFALVYLAAEDRTQWTLEGALRVEPGSAAAPLSIAWNDASAWPLSAAFENREIRVVSELEARFGALPSGAWERVPSQAAVVPIGGGETGNPGLLVVGLNPFRRFDEKYRGFLELIAGQISASMANAQAYEAERKRAEALAEIDRAKTMFFSNISHEFRTPLTLMLGPTEELLSGSQGSVPPEQRSQLELVHRNQLRLHKLVNALLDFARIEAGRAQASYEPVDLAAFTRDLASTFRSAVDRAGLRLNVDCPELPAPVFVDREMWEKLVLNLLSNAFKFTFEGGIDVSLRAEGDHVVLSVSDSGVGIPETELPRLFERFHRVEGARARTHEGSGIGLALVQELAKLHGGSVSAASVFGQGTTFTVSIPQGSLHLPQDRVGAKRTMSSTALRSDAFVEEALRWLPSDSDAPAARSARAPTPSGVETDKPKARILVADDNADMRDYLRRLLGPHFVVEVAVDGAEALEMAKAKPPDLLLTDVMMPRLDGFALLRELRNSDATRMVPVLVLSARAGEEAEVEGLDAGADDYLVKPFTAWDLLARVRAHLEIARLRNDVWAQQEHLYSLFMQAPAPICVLRGRELVYEMANDLYFEVCGRSDILGKPIIEVLPEFKRQGLDEQLWRVMRTGEPYVGKEMLLKLDRDGNGQLEDTYWTFTYAPLLGPSGQADRVMALCSDVTDQVVARRAIEKSEERFRRLVTQVQAGIAEKELNGRYILTNERYREIVGRSERELEQLKAQDITHPDDVERHFEAFARLVEHGTPFVIEKRYVKPDGSIVWVQNSVARIDDDAGRPHGVATVTIDVTQRKYAELALKESEERFRNLANNAPMMVWVTEPSGNCTFLSDTWYEFTGQSPKMGFGYGWVEAIHPEDRERAHDAFVEANERQVAVKLEYRLLRRDGEYRWVIDSAGPRRGPNGEFLGYIGSVFDITERRAAEQAVATSEARYRAIFETAEVSLWEEDFSAVPPLVAEWRQQHGSGLRQFLVENPDAVDRAIGAIRIRDVNPATLRMFGASDKQQLLDSLWTIFLPETRSVFIEELIALAEERPVFESEAALRTLSGERIDVLLTMSFGGADGRGDRVLVSLMDISPQKAAEREREARLAEVERAVRFSEIFTGILGHDLRNPLSAITSAASLLSRRAEDSERISRPVSRILTSADRMERMISQLLDFTQIRLGRGIPLDRQSLDLGELCRPIIEEVESAWNTDIVMRSTGDLRGIWDGDRLSQLVSNLSGNACQHRMPGTPIHVELDGTRADAVRLEVRNEGAIPREIRPVIFEPLRQTSEGGHRKAGSSGLGLGLYITQQIALAHGGVISVQSDEVSGTRFVVELPRHAEPESERAFSPLSPSSIPPSGQ